LETTGTKYIDFFNKENLKYKTILEECREYYESTLLCGNSLEDDIITYNVDLAAVMVAFVRICFGEEFIGNHYPTLRLSKTLLEHDGEVLSTSPSLVIIFSSLIASSIESNGLGEINFKGKDNGN
jgi:hypothetical protein